MKYELVIFDLDGTILDTLEDLTDSVNYVLAKYGYPVRTLEEIRSFVGNGLLMLMRKAIAPECKEEIIMEALAEQKAYYKIHCADKTKPYEGVIALLKALKEAGIPAAVIGRITDSNDRILINEEETRFLEPNRVDEYEKARTFERK